MNIILAHCWRSKGPLCNVEGETLLIRANRLFDGFDRNGSRAFIPGSTTSPSRDFLGDLNLVARWLGSVGSHETRD